MSSMKNGLEYNGRTSVYTTPATTGLEIPDESFVFLFCGKLTEQKRPSAIADAIARAAENNCILWGVIVGD